MFDFKKSKSSEKVLTEQEIQQKLYGKFLTNKNSAAGASEGYLRPENDSSKSRSAVLTETPHREPETTYTRSAEPIVEATDSEVPDEFATRRRESETKDKPRELFQSGPSERPKAVRVNAPVSRVSIPKKTAHFSVPKLPIKPVLSGLTAAIGACVSVVGGALFFITKLVDFRREGVRTGLAWGSGIVMLVLLLAAIHGLNSKREVAMKTAVSKPAKKAVVKKETAPVRKSISAAPVSEVVVPAESNETPLSSAKDVIESESVDTQAGVSTGRFVIQVATYVIRDDADRLLDDMKKIKLRAFVKTQSRSSGKTYYSVLIGRFETFQDAQQELAKFKKLDISRSFKDAFIRTINPQ